MKKIPLVLFLFIMILSSCTKTDDDGGSGDNPSGGDDTQLNYSYEISSFELSLSDIVLDNNDNVYTYIKADGDYILLSIDNAGNERWRKTLSNGSMTVGGNGIMISDGKVLLSYTYDQLACFSTSDGSEVWDNTLNNSFTQMAYSNGVVYVAQSSDVTSQSELSAYDLSSGSKKWTELLIEHTESTVSVNGNFICISTRFDDNFVFKNVVTMYQDKGNSAMEVWSFNEICSGNNMIWPRKAIFDNSGAVLYETGASDSCYIYSFDANLGTVNWKTLLSPLFPPKTVLLAGGESIVATYSDDDFKGLNTAAVVDATSGNVKKENSDIIGTVDYFEILLTGDMMSLVFNGENDEKIQLFDVDGNLSKTIDIDFYDGKVTYDLLDARIDSKGNLIMSLDKNIISVNLKLVPPVSGTWSSKLGTNGNTNSLN